MRKKLKACPRSITNTVYLMTRESIKFPFCMCRSNIIVTTSAYSLQQKFCLFTKETDREREREKPNPLLLGAVRGFE